MLEELRQRLRGLKKPAGLADGPAVLALGAAVVEPCSAAG